MRSVIVAVGLVWLLTVTSVSAEEHLTCGPSAAEGFSNIQIETSDIALHEQLFEQVFHAQSHPALGPSPNGSDSHLLSP